MDAAKLVAALERFVGVLPAVTARVTAADAVWKPADGAWSVLEVVRHVAEEEVRDFRVWIGRALGDAVVPAPGVDEAQLAALRASDVAEAVGLFERERRRSLAWLKEIVGTADWTRPLKHQDGWDLTAGGILAGWVAHDATHLRQIAKRFYQMAERDGAPYGAEYSGGWRA
jgi:hypothetical protein